MRNGVPSRDDMPEPLPGSSASHGAAPQPVATVPPPDPHPRPASGVDGEVLGPFTPGVYLYDGYSLTPDFGEGSFTSERDPQRIEISYPDASTMSYVVRNEDGTTESTMAWSSSGLLLLRASDSIETCTYPDGIKVLPRRLRDGATWTSSGVCRNRTLTVSGRVEWAEGRWRVIKRSGFVGPGVTQRFDFDDLAEPHVQMISGAESEGPGTTVYNRTSRS